MPAERKVTKVSSRERDGRQEGKISDTPWFMGVTRSSTVMGEIQRQGGCWKKKQERERGGGGDKLPQRGVQAPPGFKKEAIRWRRWDDSVTLLRSERKGPHRSKLEGGVSLGRGGEAGGNSQNPSSGEAHLRGDGGGAVLVDSSQGGGSATY